MNTYTVNYKEIDGTYAAFSTHDYATAQDAFDVALTKKGMPELWIGRMMIRTWQSEPKSLMIGA